VEVKVFCWIPDKWGFCKEETVLRELFVVLVAIIILEKLSETDCNCLLLQEHRNPEIES
jgi:hypothetical protein